MDASVQSYTFEELEEAKRNRQIFLNGRLFKKALQMLSIYCKSLVFTKENISVDREHNKEPQSRPATLLALTDIQHN